MHCSFLGTLYNLITFNVDFRFYEINFKALQKSAEKKKLHPVKKHTYLLSTYIM